jgi:hypothetical protein
MEISSGRDARPWRSARGMLQNYFCSPNNNVDSEMNAGTQHRLIRHSIASPRRGYANMPPRTKTPSTQVPAKIGWLRGAGRPILEVTGSGQSPSRVARGSTLSKDSLRAAFRFALCIDRSRLPTRALSVVLTLSPPLILKRASASRRSVQWWVGRATKLFCALCPLHHLAQHVRAKSQKSWLANFGPRQLRGCYWHVSGRVDLTHSLTLAG